LLLFQVARPGEAPSGLEVVDGYNLGEFMGTRWSIARRLLAGEGKADSVPPRAREISIYCLSFFADQGEPGFVSNYRDRFFACVHQEMRRRLTVYGFWRCAERTGSL
jgi:hypothetical protein